MFIYLKLGDMFVFIYNVIINKIHSNTLEPRKHGLKSYLPVDFSKTLSLLNP